MVLTTDRRSSTLLTMPALTPALTPAQQLEIKQEYERTQFARKQRYDTAFAELPRPKKSLAARLIASLRETDSMLRHCETMHDDDNAAYSAAMTFREVLLAEIDQLVAANTAASES